MSKNLKQVFNEELESETDYLSVMIQKSKELEAELVLVLFDRISVLPIASFEQLEGHLIDILDNERDVIEFVESEIPMNFENDTERSNYTVKWLNERMPRVAEAVYHKLMEREAA